MFILADIEAKILKLEGGTFQIIMSRLSIIKKFKLILY